MRNGSKAVQAAPASATTIRVRARRFTDKSSSIGGRGYFNGVTNACRNLRPLKTALPHRRALQLTIGRSCHVRDSEQDKEYEGRQGRCSALATIAAIQANVNPA